MARPPKRPRGAKQETPGPIRSNFPVVIGEGSHPFPFRTRKLSPLPPMVLRGKLRGRVGHCRDYSSQDKQPSPRATAVRLYTPHAASLTGGGTDAGAPDRARSERRA